MNSLTYLLVLGVFCLSLPSLTVGGSCYTCTSSSLGDNSGDNCANFNLFSPPPSTECTLSNTCTKVVAEVDGVLSSVKRGCAQLGLCASLNTGGNGVFCCEGNNCNSGERLYFSASFLLLSLLGYFL